MIRQFETAESVACSVDCVSQPKLLEEAVARSQQRQSRILSSLVGRISSITISPSDFDSRMSMASTTSSSTAASDESTTTSSHRSSGAPPLIPRGRFSAQTRSSQWTDFMKFKRAGDANSISSLSSRNSSKSTRTASTVSSSESSPEGSESSNNNNDEDQQNTTSFLVRRNDSTILMRGEGDDDLDDLNGLNRLYQTMPHKWKAVLHEATEVHDDSKERLIRTAYPRASEFLNPNPRSSGVLNPNDII